MKHEKGEEEIKSVDTVMAPMHSREVEYVTKAVGVTKNTHHRTYNDSENGGK